MRLGRCRGLVNPEIAILPANRQGEMSEMSCLLNYDVAVLAVNKELGFAPYTLHLDLTFERARIKK